MKFKHLLDVAAFGAFVLALGTSQAVVQAATGPAAGQLPPQAAGRLSGFDTALHAHPHGVVPHYVTSTQWSPNWSGYVAYGTGGGYNQVSSNWVQPGVVCDPSRNNWAAFWVGLDGWDSSTVEQTGVAANCVGGVASYSAWYEMYPQAPVYWQNTVAAGDQMSASVVFNGSGYVLTITDHTRSWSQTTTQGGSYSRADAEIVAEGPGSPYSTVNPLPNFGRMTFTGSMINNAQLLSANLYGVLMGTFPTSGYEWDDVRGIVNRTDFTVVWI